MLQPADTVRMQTDRSYDKIAITESRTNDPRSYIVKGNGKQYCRNRNIYYLSKKLLDRQMMMIYHDRMISSVIVLHILQLLI